MAAWTVDIIPFESVSRKCAKGVHTILITEVIGLIRCPVMEVKSSSITPNERSFTIYVRQTKPTIFSVV